jgi:CelD/BcsL family acetyltransferase involved in cellulose biosynthesis
LVTVIKDDFWVNIIKVGVRYRAKLPTSQMAFKAQCSKTLIKRLRRQKNNFESSLAGEFLPCQSLSELDETLVVLDKLHTQRWQDKDKQGAFASEKFSAFHNEFCKYAFKNKWLQLWRLKSKGHIIAVIYAIEYNDTCYFYQSGIDTYFKPNISPGYLSHLLLIEACINNKIDYYDFMKGSSKGSYKSNLSNEQFPMYETLLLKKALLNTPQILKFHVKEIVRLIKKLLIA